MRKTIHFRLATSAETVGLGRRIGRLLQPGSIVTLSGPLGAGKTTLTKGIARSIGVTEEITSPTFTIVSEYPGELTLYHIDLYRVGSDEEIELLGLEELVYGSGVSVVEWSEKAPWLFVDPISVTLAITGGEERSATVRCPEGLDGILDTLPEEDLT